MPNAPELPLNAVGTLVVITPVAAVFHSEGVTTDDKLHSGLLRYLQEWGGPLIVLTPVSDSVQPYSTQRPYDALPYRIVPFDPADPAVIEILASASVILASADDHRQLSVWQSTPRPVVYIIEYTLRTRLQQIKVTRGNVLSKLKSVAWTLLQERRLTDALKNAAGVQCNGTPADVAYRGLNRHSLLYFDTRMTDDMMITEEMLSAKSRRLADQGALRLVYSGRLEPIKGAHHLVEIAKLLRAQDIDFRLDIFGTGSLHAEMEREIVDAALGGQVKLHGAVDFANDLVPHFCQSADLFLCCHLQDDPSCTYLETLACGVPIAGYRNQAFEGVLGLGAAGALTRARTPAAMVHLIGALNADRPHLSTLMMTAARIGRAHGFERMFAERVRQIRQLSRSAADRSPDF